MFSNYRQKLKAIVLRMKTIALAFGLLMALSAYGQDNERCSQATYRDVSGHSVLDYGVVGHPLHGWVGYTNTGSPVAGVTVEAYSADGKTLMGKVTTDSVGRFSFAQLREGTYQLKARAEHVAADEPIVRVSKESHFIVCLVAEATER